jgi:site-specific recombinase XerD
MVKALVKVLPGSPTLPKLFAPDTDAARRFIEFFTANIRNPNTRRAYARAAIAFAVWCEQQDIRELQDIEPLYVATYIETLQVRLAPPSVKQHLAAIRMLFDWLVVGQVIAVNPASPVRGPKYSAKKGKTSVLSAEEARKLLDSIDTAVDGAGLSGHRKSLLFPTALGRTGKLSDRRMTQPDAYRMIGRRARDAGIATKIGNHSFRATGITEYLRNGGRREIAQQMANHESARTTGLYDRRDDEVSLDEVERIVI